MLSSIKSIVYTQPLDLLLVLFHEGYGLFWLGASFSSEDLNLDARADEVLTSVHEPLDGRNDKHDSKRRNAVVCSN